MFKKKEKRRHQNHTMWTREVSKYRFFFILMMCLSLYDYQAKTSRYRNGLTYLNNRATTKQNRTLQSRKIKRKVLKHRINGNHPEQKKEKKRNRELTGKQGLKWQ